MAERISKSLRPPIRPFIMASELKIKWETRASSKLWRFRDHNRGYDILRAARFLFKPAMRRATLA